MSAPNTPRSPYVAASTILRELTPGAIVLGVPPRPRLRRVERVPRAEGRTHRERVDPDRGALDHDLPLSVRAFGATPATILQNNIVQTTGSAGESIAAGVVFTLPALLLLGYSLPVDARCAAIAVVGGLLGVLLMIPLRHDAHREGAREPEVSRGDGVRRGAHRRRGTRRAGAHRVHGLRPRRRSTSSATAFLNLWQRRAGHVFQQHHPRPADGADRRDPGRGEPRADGRRLHHRAAHRRTTSSRAACFRSSC